MLHILILVIGAVASPLCSWEFQNLPHAEVRVLQPEACLGNTSPLLREGPMLAAGMADTLLVPLVLKTGMVNEGL